MESHEQQLLILAALLHDTGKFAQRSNAPYSENLAQEYCPGGTSHLHVLYTDYFIEKNLPLPPELESERSRLSRMASAHHRADVSSREEKSIQEGDCLSSGNDRREGESGGTYKSARMESVFSHVHLRRHDLNAEKRRYMLKALDAEGFPLFPVDEHKARQSSYADLYREFLEALKDIPCDMGVDHYLSSVQTVLERFTWCIPSSTYNTRADISLFDHAYTTAAIAQALYCGSQPNTKLRETPLLLLGGELSGIQNFIFGQGEQGDRGASKLLRARSFSLQMLTRSIWMTLLEKCNMNAVARIMDAGGRFILLLPDTPAVRNAAGEVTREAMRHVLEAFNGVLRVSFSTQELTASELDRSSFHTVFQRMNDKLEREKLRPFSPLLNEGFSPVIGIKSSDYAEFGACPFCGLRPARAASGEEAGCRICSALIRQVGRLLPDARYAVLSRDGAGFPLFGGFRLRLEKDAPTRADVRAQAILSLKDRIAFAASPAAGHVPRLTEVDLARLKAERLPVPEEELAPGAPKTFDLLAQEARIPTEKGFRSVPFLASCKADVDNLGLIFGMGLEAGGENRFSISHFSMLSRMMHHFFSSWLIHVIEERFPDIYVVFAGGDDLFVIGPWSDIVRFAEQLYSDFRRFTGDNPDVTLSAGVALAKPGLPMRSIKELAEEELERSKGREADDHLAKNAITLFGVTCPWSEFSFHLEQGEWLEELCLAGAVTQGFVRRLLGYSRQAREFAKGEISAGLYRSHMMYDMARNCEKNRNKDDMDKLRALCHDKEFQQMEISITWALYRTRTTA